MSLGNIKNESEEKTVTSSKPVITAGEAITILSKELKKDNCPKEIKRIFTVKYPVILSAQNDHDSLAKLIFLQDYTSKIYSKGDKPLSQTQAMVLAYYAIRGNCDKESRAEVSTMLNKSIKDIHSYNHSLVNSGYLEKEGFKSGNFNFSEKFKKLQEYWHLCKETQNPLTFLIEINNGY